MASIRESPAAIVVACFALLLPGTAALRAQRSDDSPLGDRRAIVFTQLPRQLSAERGDSPDAGGMLRDDRCDGARIVVLVSDSPRVLTEGFHGACDPEVSFNGRRMLFAGKKRPTDSWSIFEADLESLEIRQVTRDAGNCRHPVYVGSIYTIVDEAPAEQIAFVSDLAGEWNEFGGTPSTSIYSCRPDGSRVHRLTYNPSSDLDPAVLPDGRLVFSSWQRRDLERGAAGRVALFTAQTDGLDYAIFSGDEGKRVKHMACVTSDRSVVFVEGRQVAQDGSGTLASVSLRRNLHSYRSLSDEADGLYHSPSPVADGSLLVSRRPSDGTGTHGIYRLEPTDGRVHMIFDDPDFHDVQAKVVGERPRPDGRSSVVAEQQDTGKFYGLDVYKSDLGAHGWIPRGTPVTLRVLEGVPRTTQDAGSHRAARLPRRLLGEVVVEQDGSFNVEVPAEVPIELQLVDGEGVALRSCGWIWVRGGETRGCIGCHEDGELTPANRYARALARPSVPLTLPPAKRRTVVFERDIRPMFTSRCAISGCHSGGGVKPLLTSEIESAAVYDTLLDGQGSDPDAPWPRGRYVHPGSARTSPLAWHLLGRNCSRPWDDTWGEAVSSPMPPAGHDALTEHERSTILEWIDLGAPWSAGDSAGGSTAERRPNRGGTR